MSISKQVIPTYINHSRSLILYGIGIHLIFERGLRRERQRSQTYPNLRSVKQREISGIIFITSLV